MLSKRLMRHILLSSCCFSAAAFMNAAQAAAVTYNVASGTQTVSAVVADPDTLTKTGAGTLVLTGANTSTGTTTISAGTLQIGNTLASAATFDTTASIASASIVNAGTLVFARGDGANTALPSYTYAGVISGAGAVRQIGYGTLILTGNNTYTGVTTITGSSVVNPDATTTLYASTLQIGNGGTTGWIGSNSIVVQPNGIVSFNRSDNVAFSGIISGAGNVTQAGTGTLTLSGTNTYTGITTISAGTLVLTGAGPTGVAGVLNNANFDFSGIAAAGLTTKALNGTTVSANVITGTKNLTLTAGGTYAGLITGSGTFTVQTGTEILTGNSTGFTGAITVGPAGTLQFGAATATGMLNSYAAPITDNGTLAFARADNVVYSGVISGTGAVRQSGTAVLTLNAVNTYTGLTTVAAGTMEIGDASHRAASVAGNVTVAAAGNLMGYGRIGGSLTNLGTYTAELSPTGSSILKVGGTANLGGSFGVVAQRGYYGQFAYATPVMTASAVSGTFAKSGGASGDIAYTVAYPSATEVDVVVVPNTSGQVYGDVVSESLVTTHALNDVVLDHTGFDRCNDGASCIGWSSWAEGFGGMDHVEGSATVNAFNSTGWGLIGGVGYGLEADRSLNLAVAYTGNHLGVVQSATVADGNGLFTALTLHQGYDIVGIDMNGFYLINWNDISRQVGLGYTATSSLTTATAGGSLQVAIRLLGGDVMPVAKVTYASASYGTFTEQGAGDLSLKGIQGDHSGLYYDLGVRFSHDFTAGNGISLRPHVYVGSEMNVMDYGAEISMQLANFAKSGITAPSAATDQWAGVVRLGLETQVNQALSINANADGKFGERQQQAFFSLGASYRF